VKRREPSAERPSETQQGLRAQLSRAVGGSIDAIRSVLSSNPKTVGVSKQRLSDVLWNDRTMLRTHDTAVSRAAADGAEELPRSDVVELSAGKAEPDRVFADLEAADDAAGDDAEGTDTRSGEARKRIDTRPSELVRARLERVKARVATRLTAMPKGVAPIAADLLEEIEFAAELEPDAQTDASPAAADLTETQSEAREWLTTPTAAERTKDEILDDLAPPQPARVSPATPLSPEPGTATSSRAPSTTFASPAESPPPPAAGEDEDERDEEPIRTRSMARLLALQGHRARALKIYDALLAANGSDETLRAEADALRRAG
jgi:hypothetical protein